jgi:hypothetical protein
MRFTLKILENILCNTEICHAIIMNTVFCQTVMAKEGLNSNHADRDGLPMVSTVA